MADEKEGEVPLETINIKSTSEVGLRGIHDAQGNAVLLEPGADPVDVEVPSPWADNMRAVSSSGTSDYLVTGSEPAEAQPANQPKPPTREELNELERKNLAEARKQRSAPQPAKPGESAAGPKLSRQDMDGMTKAELAEYAATIGVEVQQHAAKHEIADAIAAKQQRSR